MNRFITYVLMLAIAVGCYCPALYMFTDAYILPKWYVCMLFSLLLVLYYGVKCVLGRQIKVEVKQTFINSFILISFIAALYVICEIATRGFSPIGEAGTFDNPAGLSLNMSVALSVLICRYNKCASNRSKLVGLFLCVLFLMILVATKSRTGLIFIVVWLVFILTKRFKMRLLKVILSVLMVAALISVIATFKKDSTSGRFFILSNSMSLIKEHPIMGHGQHGFERRYMLKQAEFFVGNQDSRYALLADEVQHPLNEFVYLWVNYGVIAPLALFLLFAIPVIAVCRNKREDDCCLLPLSCVLVFSFFSYPFMYPISWLVIIASYVILIRGCIHKYSAIREKLKNKYVVCMVLLSGITAISFIGIDIRNEYKWNEAWKHVRHIKDESGIEEYRALQPYFRSNRFFLYNYAYALYYKGLFEEAIDVGRRCQQCWNGYNLQLLLGDACRMARRYDESLACYEMAYNMCPVRLAPLEGMYLVYQQIGDEKEKERVADLIANHSVKVQSYDTYRIKKNCR